MRQLILLGLSLLGGSAGFGAEALSPAQYRRMVFLGSSTTDGHTYPALLQQALREAKRPVPLCFNAGVGGNVTAEMASRLERDVLVHKPTLVVLQTGANDAGRPVTVDDYLQSVKTIVELLQAENILIIALITNIRGENSRGVEKTVGDYNDALRKLADRYPIRIAEAYALQAQARTEGKQVVEEDGIHPNYEGHRLIARALLDAMGLPEVAVPAQLQFELYPGLLPEWHLKPVADGKVLDDASVLALRPDETWVTYPLPEPGALTNWWLDGERQHGFAVSLASRLGKAKRYYGVAYCETEAPREVFINTGAGLQTVWLNGQCLYKSADYRGWHAGRTRVPTLLPAGRNVLTIETTDTFFLSLTATQDW